MIELEQLNLEVTATICFHSQGRYEMLLKDKAKQNLRLIKENKRSKIYTKKSNINVREYRRGNQKLTIKRNWQHMVHKTKKNKAKHKYVLDTTVGKQTQLTYIRHAPSYKQLEEKTNRTSVVCGRKCNRSRTL